VLKFEEGFHQFETIEEHDQQIIERWNSVVQEDDVVFFLGDAALHRVKLSYLVHIFSQLKGQIIWLRGNHCDHINFEWQRQLKEAASSIEFKDYEEIFFKDTSSPAGIRRVCLFHYPILEFNGKYRGAYHLYGHSHTVVHDIYGAYSVCACITDYRPVNFDWVQSKITEHNERLNRLSKQDI
jgi:calcineurin-like phosphoesterase family protein